jgi:calcium-dependent protein kinase
MGACFSSASAAPAGAAVDERRPSKEGDGKKRRRAAGASPDAAAPVRVEFGYERDFEARYEVGRLLGHGQFGYTFAATDRGSGDRVAVKRIDKAKVSCRLPPRTPSRRAVPVSVSPTSSSSWW